VGKLAKLGCGSRAFGCEEVNESGVGADYQHLRQRAARGEGCWMSGKPSLFAHRWTKSTAIECSKFRATRRAIYRIAVIYDGIRSCGMGRKMGVGGRVTKIVILVCGCDKNCHWDENEGCGLRNWGSPGAPPPGCRRHKKLDQ